MNMKVSIITITFNAEKDLLPTIQSVKSQTFTDYEHILVDGASTDGTIALARSQGVKGMRILSEPDSGLYDAMNKGLKMALGEFVIFLNAGDTFANKHILQKYAEAATDNVDIVYADTLLVNEKRQVIKPRHLYAPEKLTVDSFSKGMLICHQAFLMRRSLAPLYDLKYRFSADYDWTVKCIKATTSERCVNLHIPAIHYLTLGLTDANKLDSLKERFRIMKEHYGAPTAIARHLSFIPRALIRKLLTNNTPQQND